MNYLSKKYLPETFLNFKLFNLLPGKLEKYRGVLEITFDHTQYTPSMRSVVLALALANHDNAVLRDYFEREYYNFIDDKGLPSKDVYQNVTEYYHQIYDTRMEHFDFDAPLFKQILCYAKIPFSEWKEHFNNSYMETFKDIIIVLSTDFSKLDQNTNLSRALMENRAVDETINSLLFMIANSHLSKEDVAEISRINPWIGKLLMSNIDVLLSFKNLDNKGKAHFTPLHMKMNFAGYLLSYLLLNVSEEEYGIFEDVMLKELPAKKDQDAFLSSFLHLYSSVDKKNAIIKEMVDKYRKSNLTTEKDKQYVFDTKPND